MLSQEQKWAQAASSLVKSRVGAEWDLEYGRLCLRLPTMILQCGLCQTVAFIESKHKQNDGTSKAGKIWFGALLEDLAFALASNSVPGNADPTPSETRAWLITESREASLSRYQRLSHDALQCSNYFKRYAEAFLKVDPSEQLNSPDAEEFHD